MTEGGREGGEEERRERHAREGRRLRRNYLSLRCKLILKTRGGGVSVSLSTTGDEGDEGARTHKHISTHTTT